jgi:hypothetical protein
LDRGFLLLPGNSFNGNVKLILLLFLLKTGTACETVMMFVTRGVLIPGCNVPESCIGVDEIYSSNKQ